MVYTRQFSVRREVDRADKRETEDELERLEIRGKHANRGSVQPSRAHQQLEDAMTKGKLLTTPSRLFKLLIPLPTANHNSQHMDVEPIAILIHPQQPLSYLGHLIQNEVPDITIDGCKPRPPAVSFIALQIEDKPLKPNKAIYEETDSEVRRLEGIGAGVEAQQARRQPNEGDDTYSYLRRMPARHDNVGPSSHEQRFVRWSESTEIGDFVRDASRAREFIVNIEGAPAGVRQIHVAVPSFEERTHFLRMRLRRIAEKIRRIAEIKNECDALAQRGAQRVAIGGFGVLALWWYLVYRLTFETDLGWDTMEPVTYLASLSTLMGGYLWFLYHNREISYRSALDFTINARQKKLYQMKGVDLPLWESLIDEGNTLRKEIKNIAAEYEEYWDEKKDERDERVTEALKKDRNAKNGSHRSKDQDHDDD
ncbi:hypothetical protein BDV59DRAFT_203788 [Aspergillus ambiguus]|uniref:uncharacterized protein n=1 Tax=Aspergillus ambiguus TaxID=176160 RepID=UPI003CCDD799